jgi:hypothetical protein
VQTAQWWKNAVLSRSTPAASPTPTVTASATSTASPALRLPRAARGRRYLAVLCTAHRRTTSVTTSATTRTSTPCSGDAGGLRWNARQHSRVEHEARHGPRGQHTSDDHLWFEESRLPNAPKRDWFWWRPVRPGWHRGASRDGTGGAGARRLLSACPGRDATTACLEAGVHGTVTAGIPPAPSAPDPSAIIPRWVAR